MFALLPYNTDAPVYFRPWATVGLLVANVVAFFLTGGGTGDWAEAWTLHYGEGLRPWEWITCHFLHFGIFHLVGNVIFLWGIGLVVEGKLGWWRFLLLYLAIGVVHAFIEQLALLGYDGPMQGSGGASGIVYALLAIALVWAPKNELSVFYFFFFFLIRVGTFEVTILTFATWYLVLEFLLAWLWQGFAISSEMIHLLGAVVGFAAGVAFLKSGWVDCENWDLFAVLKGTHGNRDPLAHAAAGVAAPTVSSSAAVVAPAGETSQSEDMVELAEKRAEREAKTLQRIRRQLQTGQARAALAEYRRFKHIVPEWQLPERDLRSLTNGLYRARAWSEVIPFLEEYIDRYSSNADGMRLKLAGIAVQQQKRPRYALRLLGEVSTEELSEKRAGHFRKIDRQARRMIDEGVIELDGQAWS